MFPIAKVTSVTNKGDKIITGSDTNFVDPSGSATISVSVGGHIYTYTAEEVEAQSNDDNFDRAGVTTNPSTPSGATDVDDSNNNTATGTTVDCVAITGNVNYSYPLSQNFILANVSSKAVFSNQIVAQNGLTVAQIICNLKNVAENCLEPIAAQFGRKNMFITSGFRPAAQKTKSGKVSQHTLGEACDVQFAGWTADQYFQNAKWIKEHVPYDQFILEYHGHMPVLHLSFSKKQMRKQVLSTADLINYYPGLQKLR